MKTIWISILAMCLAATAVMAEDIRIEAGLVIATVAANLGNIAVDMAPALEGNDGPAEGVCWEFGGFNLVIWLYSTDGKITTMGYWLKADFVLSPYSRAASERRALALVLSMDRGTVLVKSDLGFVRAAQDWR